MEKENYFDYLSRAMTLLASAEKTIFCGQAVAVEGTAMRKSLLGVPESKLIEFPVDEDFQMGFATGLSFAGYLPICIFPRFDFLLVATNQIVNYLDKLGEVGRFSIPPKVIIRTSVGSKHPLDPGPQHIGDYTDAFKLLLKNVEVILLDKKEKILPSYERAQLRQDGVSTLIIEYGDYYNK
jgi:pyruvate/2-oxoglutarate/acetoin dehydrogenase E1 component